MLDKANCGEQVSVDQMRRSQIQMLDALANFCDNNGIHYYLDGGTLLGAVRHKGFIPWDDDIDVIIPHPDCKKLQSLTKGYIGKYILSEPSITKSSFTESWKLYDPDLVIESDLGGTSSKKVFFYVFIDIFQMEGLPNTEKETASWYRKTMFYRKLLNSIEGSWWHGKTIPRKIFHGMMRPIVNLIGPQRVFKKLQDSKERLDFSKALYVGNMSGPVHTTESRVLKEAYMRPAKLFFEGKEYCVPGNFKQYLTQLYGADSMTSLPPKEKRKTNHSFKVYKYIEEE